MTGHEPRFERSRGTTGAGIALMGLLALDVSLGGATLGSPVFDFILQFMACVVLGWCIVDTSLGKARASALWLISFLVFAALVALAQLAPLPLSFWEGLPGRAEPSEALRLVGGNESARPLSLAPLKTLESIFWLLPLAAMLVLSTKLSWRTLVTAVRWSVPALAATSAVLGIAQVVAADQVSLFLHEGPAKGHAAGFFQVVNHQPTLQLMAMPFLAVLAARLGARFDAGDAFQAQAVVLVTLMLVLLAGLVAAGSVAGFALLLPVLLASAPIALHRGLSVRVLIVLLACAAGLGAGAFYIADSPLLTGVGVTDLDSGPLSRVDSWARAATMARDYFPVGAGLGAFRDAFGAYEDPLVVTNQFVAHAHNDYLEIIVEMGLPGAVLIVGVVGWWAVMTVIIWRRPVEEGLRTRKAATIAVAVVLLHSLVDSPARTEAIACLTALCLGLMASGPNKRSEPSAESITAHRHIEL